MSIEVTWAPGAVGATTDFDLPANSPAIEAVISAVLMRCSDGTAAAAEVAAVPTKIDENTIQLDVATQTLDLLTLKYTPVGAQVKP